MKTVKKTKDLRPTTGKVREALFNILRGRMENTCFLDLYAGTGAVGIGAVEQGASQVTFVELSKKNAAAISKYLDKLRLTENAEIVAGHAVPFIERAGINRETFDIIFLDPPYHADEVTEALSALGKADILNEDGVVIAEHFAKRQLPESFGFLHKVKDYRYGDTVLSFYERQCKELSADSCQPEGESQ